MNRAISASALLTSMALAVGAQAGTMGNDRMYNGKSVHGEAVTAPQNARVVDVEVSKAVNVTCGEVVTFQNGGKSFSWKFDSADHRAVDVRAIAPAGFANKPLMVYVSKNESERN